MAQVRELACYGFASLAEHFDALLLALRSPVCCLFGLTLSGCDWPAGRNLEELLDAVAAENGDTLRELVIANMGVGGTLPSRLFEACPHIETLDLGQMDLSGPLPPTVGLLTQARNGQ